VRPLETDGHDTTRAESLLREMENGLEAMHAHRDLIAGELSKALGETG
jgi:hypothetical protein